MDLSLRSRFQKTQSKASAAAEALNNSRLLFLRCGRLRRGRFFILAAEALHASGGVHQFLLAGKEGVAVGADFQADFAFVGGTGGKHIAASAVHARVVVCGMDSCLHGLLNLSLQKLYFSGFGRIWLFHRDQLDSAAVKTIQRRSLPRICADERGL